MFRVLPSEQRFIEMRKAQVLWLNQMLNEDSKRSAEADGTVRESFEDPDFEDIESSGEWEEI